MNQMSLERRAAVVRCLVEGNSIRSTVRITGAAKNTVTKLLVDLGRACAAYQAEALRGIKADRIQCDEIWSFVGCKDKNKPEETRDEFGTGDVWTWTAMDADTKLMITWYVGDRDTESGIEFMKDLRARVANRPQVTTDGHRVYFKAVPEAFGKGVDYGRIIKTYGLDAEGEKRYSPNVCTGIVKESIIGDPDPEKISTSYVERSNLDMRMGMRRFTRLTNAFSKKVENHMAAVALHFMYINFGRVHGTLKTTPAIKAGIADHVWSIEEIVALLDR